MYSSGQAISWSAMRAVAAATSAAQAASTAAATSRRGPAAIVFNSGRADYRIPLPPGGPMSRLFAPLLLLAATAAGAAEMPPPLPPLREQDRIRQEWVKLRLERVLPALMRRHGVAMWIVACREYNEDPVFFSLVSPTVMAAR